MSENLNGNITAPAEESRGPPVVETDLQIRYGLYLFSEFIPDLAHFTAAF
jgi:hypothetical protein